MATNLFNKDHKAASEEYRKGYDRIKWGKQNEGDKNKDKEDTDG